MGAADHEAEEPPRRHRRQPGLAGARRAGRRPRPGRSGRPGRSRPSRSTSSATWSLRRHVARSARLCSQSSAWACARSSARAVVARVGHAVILVPSCGARRDPRRPPSGGPAPRRTRRRLAPYVEPHLARRRRPASKHPVHDFLFSYYSQRPAQLLRWHPGYGVALVDARGVRRAEGLRPTAPSAGHRRTSRPSGRCSSRPTGCSSRPPSRPAHTGCFGLHEWAMVYRRGATRPGTPQPLRLGGAGTDTVVESHRIACSHFDAFRFFTDEARPRNTLSPGPDDRPDFEQPGCLHAGMDLYKHAFRLTPMVVLGPGRRLLRAGVGHPGARHARRAVRPDGRGARPHRRALDPGPDRDARGQAGVRRSSSGAFAERGAPLRQRLVEECERLLGAAGRWLSERSPTRATGRTLARGRGPVSPRSGAPTSRTPGRRRSCAQWSHEAARSRAAGDHPDAGATPATADPAREAAARGGHPLDLAVVPRRARDHDPVRVHQPPYYAPDPRCSDDRGFHHGIDVRMKCGTPLRAGRRGWVTGTEDLGPAYGSKVLRIRNYEHDWDVVIGHARRVLVEPRRPGPCRAADRTRRRERRAGRLPPPLREASRGRRPVDRGPTARGCWRCTAVGEHRCDV